MFHHRDMACYMADGHRVCLGPLFLADLFRGINKFIERVRGTEPMSSTSFSGPIWFLEIWLRFHFVDARVPSRSIVFPSPDVPPTLTILQGTAEDDSVSLTDLVRGILNDKRGDFSFFSCRRAMKFVRPPFWVNPATLSSSQDPGEKAIWDSIIRPRSLLCSVWHEKNRPKVKIEPYMPHLLARQLGCCQGIPRLVSHLNLSPPGDDEGFISLDQAVSYAKTINHYISSQTILPFKLTPCALTNMKEWWKDNWPKIGREPTEFYLEFLRTNDPETKVKMPDFSKVDKILLTGELPPDVLKRSKALVAKRETALSAPSPVSTSTGKPLVWHILL